MGIVGQETALGVEGLLVVATGGACLLRPEGAIVHLLNGHLGQRTQDGEIDAVLLHGLLGEGVDGIAEVVNHDSREVCPATLLKVETVDALAYRCEELFYFGVDGGGAALDAEGQMGIVHGDVANERLG